MFEQQGDLDPTGLPAGAEPRTIDGQDVRQYRTPGGVVMVWQSGDVVYTTVSDAPVDQIDHVLADFGPSPSPNALDRVTNFVLGPFSWLRAGAAVSNVSVGAPRWHRRRRAAGQRRVRSANCPPRLPGDTQDDACDSEPDQGIRERQAPIATTAADVTTLRLT